MSSIKYMIWKKIIVSAYKRMFISKPIYFYNERTLPIENFSFMAKNGTVNYSNQDMVHHLFNFLGNIQMEKKAGVKRHGSNHTDKI
jgi:hypothetical protein